MAIARLDPPATRVQHPQGMNDGSSGNQPSDALRRAGLPWPLLVLGLLIAYSPSYINILLSWAGADWALIKGPPSVILWNWLAVLCLLVFILKVEGRDLASISLRPPGTADIQWAFVFWGAATLFNGWLHSVAPPPPSDGLDIVLALSLPLIVALILTTAVTEEVLYRGYSIERLAELTGRRWLAVAISFSLFVLPHLAFFGPHWILYHGLNVVLLYILYLWRRNLWACMLMHLLGNALLLIPALGLAD
jgi:membrane protease YdiL (CAAX protease family)